MRRQMPATQVKPAHRRQTVQVRLGDGEVLEAPVGTPLEAFIRAASYATPGPIVAALVNGELRELTYPVTTDVDVAPVSMANSDGMRLYRRSLAFVLVTAAQELFPDAQVVVDHSLPFGGFFCRVQGREPFTSEEVTCLKKRMQDIIAEDAPIVKTKVPLDEAMAMFKERGDEDKVALLAHRDKEYLILYQLHDTRDYFHGYMVPSTGYLRWFDLRHCPPGFVLQYPRRHQPTKLLEYREYPQLVTVFRQYGQWLHVIGVEHVGVLNQAIEAGRIGEVVLVSEALHEQRISEIAQQIAQRRGATRLVLIAGPSSAGKTTFTKRLAVHLLANGIRPLAISLDDYFLGRQLTPRDEEGRYDFEALGALDLRLFNEQLLRLMDGQEVTLPRYNFHTGQRETGDTVAISREHIILVEGIHGLNPSLVPQVPSDIIYRIYVSALTQLNIDWHNRVPTTDTRLMRRIVRDVTQRGYSAASTIDHWESVRRGEKRYIFPYQEHADVMFNSALVYELAVLKPLAEPLLLQIEPGTRQRVEAKRLLALLKWFIPCPADLVPDNSILREFTGGSILSDFKPWHRR